MPRGTVAAQKVQQYTQYYPDPPVSSVFPTSLAYCPLPTTTPRTQPEH
jgi:hypothetical protein